MLILSQQGGTLDVHVSECDTFIDTLFSHTIGFNETLLRTILMEVTRVLFVGYVLFSQRMANVQSQTTTFDVPCCKMA